MHAGKSPVQCSVQYNAIVQGRLCPCWFARRNISQPGGVVIWDLCLLANTSLSLQTVTRFPRHFARCDRLIDRKQGTQRIGNLVSWLGNCTNIVPTGWMALLVSDASLYVASRSEDGGAMCAQTLDGMLQLASVSRSRLE